MLKGYTHKPVEQNSQKQTHTYILNWFPAKIQRQFKRERIIFYNNSVGVIECLYTKKNLYLYLTPCEKKTQNGLDLNVKPKTINILKKALEILFFLSPIPPSNPFWDFHFTCVNIYVDIKTCIQILRVNYSLSPQTGNSSNIPQLTNREHIQWHNTQQQKRNDLLVYPTT